MGMCDGYQFHFRFATFKSEACLYADFITYDVCSVGLAVHTCFSSCILGLMVGETLQI